jgi:competence protein ComEA
VRSPALVSRQALSRLATRVVGSRFAKPIARVVLVAAGLVLLAVIGRASAAGALGFAPSLVTAPVTPSIAAAMPIDGAMPIDAGLAPSTLGVSVAPALPAPTDPPASAAPPASSRGRASSDDPVVLNTATVDDLRRLPGIGQKRADAILALRARVGRFRAVEDLMKVKGIGRAMIKRLRPLVRVDGLDIRPVRLDAPPATSGARLDAGAIPPR